MPTTLSRIIIGAIVTTVVGLAARAQPVRDRTLRIDVVELLNDGKEVEGKQAFAAKHGKFTYWFASEANMMIFLMNEDKYEVQLGGACARMGPLSGEGTTKLFAAHNGRLYIFASEQCKARFLETPDAFLESPDPAPQTTEESRKRGRALLGKAVDALACMAGIDNLTSYQEQLARDEKSGETTYRVTNTLTIAFPGKVRSDECWNESCWGNALDGKNGWLVSKDDVQPMEPVQRAAFVRETTHPLMILRARDAADLVIVADGVKRTIAVPEEGDVEVELVTVHRQGVTTTLGIDEVGRVRLMTLRGRGPNATLGEIEHIYSAFHDVGGLRMPGRVDVTFNGKPVASQSGAYAEQTINKPEHTDHFIFHREPAA